MKFKLTTLSDMWHETEYKEVKLLQELGFTMKDPPKHIALKWQMEEKYIVFEINTIKELVELEKRFKAVVRDSEYNGLSIEGDTIKVLDADWCDFC